MNHKKWSRLPIFLSLLILAATALFLAGRDEFQDRPSPFNTRDSGIAAFVELLKIDGYHVTVNRDEAPTLKTSDFVIVPILHSKELSNRTIKRLNTHWKPGGSILTMNFESGKTIQTARTEEIVLPGSSRRVFKVDTKDASPFHFPDLADEPFYESRTNQGTTLVRVWANGKGSWMDLTSGQSSTNKFLGQNDNAAFLLSLVNRSAPMGSNVVVSTAGIGEDSKKGILGEFGDWAVVAQWQFLLLLAVIALTLGTRFGQARTFASTQRGSRQLLDAVAELLQRSGKAQFAAKMLVMEAVKKKKHELRYSRSEPDSVVVLRLSESEQESYHFILEDQPKCDKLKLIAAVRSILMGLEAL